MVAAPALGQDNTPPSLQSATINGTTLTITYDEALDTNSVPTTNGFMVLKWFETDPGISGLTWTHTAFYCVAGNTNLGCIENLSAIAVIGNTVILTLPTRSDSGQVLSRDSIKMQYSRSHAVNPIKDTSNNEAPSFINPHQIVENLTPGPEVESAVIGGSKLTLEFDRILDETAVPPLDAWKLYIEGNAEDIISEVSVTGTTVLLTLSQFVSRSAVATLDYTQRDPDAGHVALKDTVGHLTWTFNGLVLDQAPQTDLLQKAWLARFGRTVANQVISAVEDRIAKPRKAGFEVTLAGVSTDAWDSKALKTQAEAMQSCNRACLQCRTGCGQSRTMTLFADAARPTGWTSFSLTDETTDGNFASVWGGWGAISSFNGREGTYSIDGKVRSLMVGADWTGEPNSGADSWTTGMLLAHSRGTGNYRNNDDAKDGGRFSSSMIGAYPYAHYMLNERVTLWGVAGYGDGSFKLTQNESATLKADMNLIMAAGGLRSMLMPASEDGGLEITAKSDAMIVRTTSAALQSDVGELVATKAKVTQLRFGLVGMWRGIMLGDGALTPRLDIGVRYDEGDAETGFGLGVGAGLAWSNLSEMTAEVKARALLANAGRGGGIIEKSWSGSLVWDPQPDSDRGPNFTLRQTLGAQASVDTNALFNRKTLTGFTSDANDGELQRRLEIQFGYGFPAFGDRFTSTPKLDLNLSNDARAYSLGWQLNLTQDGPVGLVFQMEQTHHESINTPDYNLGLRLTALW